MLYLIQTVKLVINVVILKLCRLCLHFNMHVLCLILVLRKVLSCYFMVTCGREEVAELQMKSLYLGQWIK